MLSARYEGTWHEVTYLDDVTVSVRCLGGLWLDLAALEAYLSRMTYGDTSGLRRTQMMYVVESVAEADVDCLLCLCVPPFIREWPRPRHAVPERRRDARQHQARSLRVLQR